jgi:hypothetical protein
MPFSPELASIQQQFPRFYPGSLLHSSEFRIPRTELVSKHAEDAWVSDLTHWGSWRLPESEAGRGAGLFDQLAIGNDV